MTPRQIWLKSYEHILREHRAQTTKKPQLYYQGGQWHVLVDISTITGWNYFHALDWAEERNREATTTTSPTHAAGEGLPPRNRRMADRHPERTGWRAATVRPAAGPRVTGRHPDRH